MKCDTLTLFIPCISFSQSITHGGTHAEISAVNNIPNSELTALQDLYTSTHGEHWTWLNISIAGIIWDFSSTANPCADDWQGIICIVEANTYHISSLLLPSYNLTGPLPDTISELTHLVDVNLRVNWLSGTLPATIEEMAKLRTIVLYVNELSGTIPASLSQLSLLEELDLGANKFHGTIPPEFGDLERISFLYTNENLLEGTIPPSLGNLVDLVVLYIGDNMLTGHIPESLGNLTGIEELVFYINYLSGPLPTTWDNFTKMEYLDFGSNLFTGTVPAIMSTMERLQYFFVNDNFMVGTIPSEFGDLVRVKELFFYDNHLTGSVPTSFANLAAISDLSLENNHLEGPLDGVFNATTQRKLSSFTINNNRITGFVPDELFYMENLLLFVAAVNCLEVSLSPSMCESPLLSTLSLDGLNTAPQCRYVLFPGLSSSYVSVDENTASVLNCLFQRPNLKTLHLSAAGLVGTLPDDIVLSSALVDLSLSHNLLTGTIPLNFQSHRWTSLDLSYNRFSGTMDASLAAFNASKSSATDSMSLYLENNRISGSVPSAVHNLLSVSVLGSNILTCNLDYSDLPSHDSDKNKYLCGSTSFEIPFYVWLAMIGALSLVALSSSQFRAFWDRHTDFTNKLALFRMWLMASSGTYGEWKDRIKSVVIISRLCEMLCRTALWCLAYIMLVLLPIYVAFGYYFNTMTFRYAYSVSVAFLSGIVPAAVLCVALVGLLVVLIAVYVRYLPTYKLGEMQVRLESRTESTTHASVDARAAQYSTLTTRINNTFIYSLFAVVNMAVVVGANYVYIYFVVYQSNKFLVLSQILLALFKLMWSGPGINVLVKYATKYLILRDKETRIRAAETRFIMLQILLTLLNNIVIPCVVVAVVSESCFYYAFVAAPLVNTYLPYEVCTSYELNTCLTVSTGVTTLSFDPPYRYNYQCSSSIITIYAPAYVTLCIMATFFIPAIEVLARHVHSKTDPQSFTHKFIDKFLPLILKPIDLLNEESLQVQPRRHFPVNQLLVMLINLLGLLLTFGAVFPPLAVALSLTLIAVSYFVKMKVGRFLCNAAAAGRMNYVDLIEAECQKAGTVAVLYRSAWLLVIYSCGFFTLFLFDTLGDAEGFDGAYWVLIVMPLMPLCMYLVYKLYHYAVDKAAFSGFGATAVQDRDVSVEMRSVGSEGDTTCVFVQPTINALFERK